MTEHIIFYDCSETEKAKIRDYWQRKKPRVEKLLKTFPADLWHLRLTINNGKQGWQAQAVLSLPTGTLIARTKPYQKNYQQAIEVLVDQLVSEIRRHKEKLHRDEVYRRKNRQASDFAAAAPFLTEDKQQNLQTDFFELLRPVLKSLRNSAQREIIFAQLQGKLNPGELTVSDLFDEMIVRAWEQFSQEIPQQPWERWLTQIMHEIIDEYKQKHIPTIPLEEVIPPEDPRYEAVEGWVQENEPFWQDLEPLTIEDLVPGYEATEPWYQLTLAEQERWLYRYLNTLPPEKRRAFMLYALEGWEVEEIALLQKRSPEEVQADIQSAQQYLEEQLKQAFPPEEA